MKSSKNIIRFFSGLLGVALLAFTAFSLMWAADICFFDMAPAGLAFAFVFGDLDWTDEPENMGGLTSSAYIAITSHIATEPTLKADPANDAEATTLQGSYVMEAGKHFIEVYSTPDTFTMAPENQGEVDGQSFRVKGELFYPGTRKEAIAFARKINNARGVVIGVDPNTGDRMVVGSKAKPAYFKPSVTTGAAAADRRGVKIEFWADSFLPFAFYNGAIPLSSGDIPAIS